MSTQRISTILAIAMVSTAVALPAQMTPPADPSAIPTEAAPTEAVPAADPELVGALAEEIGGTPEQAEGAAGALFSLARTRLKPEDWAKVAGAVPGMEGLLKAAPAATPGMGALAGALPGAAGLTGLAGTADSFKKLGLKPEMVMKAVPVLTDYVSKAGGAEVGKLLAGALQ